MIGTLKNCLRLSGSDWLWSGDNDDIIVLHEPDGRFAKVSESIRYKLGYQPTDLAGKPLTEILVPEDRREVLSMVSRVAMTGQKGRTECRLIQAGGGVIWTEMTVSADNTGRLRSIIRDIAERRSHDRARETARAEAEADAETKATYLADLSHEIRTPLSAMIGFADMMRNETFGPVGHEKYGEYAELIHKSGQHLLSLVSDLLDMAKIEAGKFSIEKEPVTLQELVTECVEITRLGAENAGLWLKTDIEPGLPAIMLDPKALRQILLNLLSNAVKFTETGGITVRLRHNDANLWLSVIDTGIGMSEDHLARIGDRFEQAHREGVRGAKGTGLGLALTSALAELHDGELLLSSRSGEGTEATVCLPRIGLHHRLEKAPANTCEEDETAFDALARQMSAQLDLPKSA